MRVTKFEPGMFKYSLLLSAEVISMNQSKRWIPEHFEELVDEYGGQYIAVVDDQVVAVGTDPKEVEDESLLKHPDVIPSILKVPKEEEIVCLL